MSVTKLKKFNIFSLQRIFFLLLVVVYVVGCTESAQKAAPKETKQNDERTSKGISEHVVEMGKSLLNDSAFIIYSKQLEAAKKSKDVKKLFEGLNKISEFLYYKASYDSSLVYLNQALELSKTVDSPAWRSVVELHLGNVWISKLDYMKGMTHYLEALKWAEKDGGAMQGSISQKLGSLYIRLKRYPEALNYLDAAERNALKFKNEFLLTLIYTSKGNVYASKAYNQRDRSNEYLKKAYALAKRHNWRLVEQNALIFLARNEVAAKAYKSALDHLSVAEAVYSGNESGAIQILIYRAKCYLETGDLAAAKKNIVKARGLSEVKRRYFLSSIFGLLSALEEKKGNYKSALDYHKQSKLYKDSVEGGDIKDSIALLKYQYQMVKKDNELIRNKLFIQRQGQEIYRKNYLAYSLIIICVLITVTFFLVIRYRQRIQKHKNELTAWKAKVEGEELERARIAAILHDTVGATLSTASMWLKNAGTNDEKLNGNEDYQEGLKLLHIGLESIRDGAHNLMPDLLKRLGLPEAIGVYCTNVERATDVTIQYQHCGPFESVSDEVALTVYRTIQELVNNVIKHANASTIILFLSCHKRLLAITVEDNGAGFDIKTLKTSKGIGLQNISNNTKYLKGQFSVTSEIGMGTSVYVEYVI
jgi:two-component system, NarL family, sensor kinase